MKGYIDEHGLDRAPCGLCKHRDRLTIEAPCYTCISVADLAAHKPCCETEFAAFERKETAE